MSSDLEVAQDGWIPEPEDLPQRTPAASSRPPWWRRIGRGGRFTETWVPEMLRDARIDPSRRGAVVLSLVAAVAAVAAAIGVWRDRPEPRAVQTLSRSALSATTDLLSGSATSPTAVPIRSGTPRGGSAATPAPPAGASSAPAGGTGRGSALVLGPAVLAVSVTGAVRRPGLVRVPSGSRVADAIAAAGGATSAADITGLNVATLLTDGDSVVVGTAGSVGSVGSTGSPGTGAGVSGTRSATASSGSGPLDLNSADEAAFEELPGVGPVMAGNIIAWRTAHGPFSSIEQLQEISGIGPARYAQLSPLVKVG